MNKSTHLSGTGAGKATTLNPNAAEFVPFSLKSSIVSNSSADASSQLSASAAPKNSVYDRSESSISINSDEEAHQYWDHKLPDDITPDFKVMGADEVQGINIIPFSSLSLSDINEGSRYSLSTGGAFNLTEKQGLSPQSVNNSCYSEKINHPVSSYGEYTSPGGIQSPLNKPWEIQIATNDQLLSRELSSYNGHSGHGFPADMLNDKLFMDQADVNPIEFLASQFPSFAAGSLTEVFLASGGDLSLTIEMLTQLELQVDGGVNQAVTSKALSVPNLTGLDFPALSVTGGQNHTSEKENTLLYRPSSSISSGGAIDFASAVRKMAAQDASIWKYDRNGSSETNSGLSRSSQSFPSSYSSGQTRGILSDRLHHRGSAQAAPIWLETGESVGTMYSEMREDARDHARLRNAYFEQARQAFLIGNKALAKELSYKGQLHNMQMKEAHGKAQESIFRQRNSDVQVNGRERMIDLHGLHVSEAIHVLKRELSALKSAARSTDQRLLVYICVGTGHHTRGSRTPARLPTAVQRFLLEEGLDYSEPQPGLLRVVIY